MVRLKFGCLTLLSVNVVVLADMHAARRATAEMEALSETTFLDVVGIIPAPKVSSFQYL